MDIEYGFYKLKLSTLNYLFVLILVCNPDNFVRTYSRMQELQDEPFGYSFESEMESK